MRLNLNSVIDAISTKILAVGFIIKSSLNISKSTLILEFKLSGNYVLFAIMLKLCGVVAIFQLNEFTNELQIIDDCIFCQSFDLKLQ